MTALLWLLFGVGVGPLPTVPSIAYTHYYYGGGVIIQTSAAYVEKTRDCGIFVQTDKYGPDQSAIIPECRFGDGK